MAAMALVSIKYLEEDNLVRRSLASTYLKILSKNTQIECVKHPNIEKITFSSRHLFQIILPSKINRDEFILKLNELGIFPGVHYKSNSFYKPYKHMAESVPNAENLSKRILSLPLHLELTNSDVEFISNTISNLVKQ